MKKFKIKRNNFIFISFLSIKLTPIFFKIDTAVQIAGAASSTTSDDAEQKLLEKKSKSQIQDDLTFEVSEKTPLLMHVSHLRDSEPDLFAAIENDNSKRHKGDRNNDGGGATGDTGDGADGGAN